MAQASHALRSATLRLPSSEPRLAPERACCRCRVELAKEEASRVYCTRLSGIEPTHARLIAATKGANRRLQAAARRLEPFQFPYAVHREDACI